MIASIRSIVNRLGFVIFHDIPVLCIALSAYLPDRLLSTIPFAIYLHALRATVSIQAFRINRNSRFPLYPQSLLSDPFGIVSISDTYVTRSIGCTDSFINLLHSDIYQTLVKQNHLTPVKSYSLTSKTFVVDYIPDLIPVLDLEPKLFLASLIQILDLASRCDLQGQVITDCDLINFSWNPTTECVLLHDYGSLFRPLRGLCPTKAIFYTLIEYHSFSNLAICQIIRQLRLSNLLTFLCRPTSDVESIIAEAIYSYLCSSLPTSILFSSQPMRSLTLLTTSLKSRR